MAMRPIVLDRMPTRELMRGTHRAVSSKGERRGIATPSSSAATTSERTACKTPSALVSVQIVQCSPCLRPRATIKLQNS